MKVSTTKLQLLTVAAILVLFSGGIAVYADQSQTTSTTTSSSTATTSTSSADTSTTTSTTTTTTVTSTATPVALCAPETGGKVGTITLPIVPSQSSGSIGTYIPYSGCVASIRTVGGVFDVQVHIQHATRVTQYTVVLVANGTSYTLGNMVTGTGGEGQIDNQVLLTPGTYTVSIQIFTTSNGQSTLVLQTPQGTVVSPPFPSPSAHNPQPNTGRQDKP
jgi:hypothetical protein